jgi:hypothetical protein
LLQRILVVEQSSANPPLAQSSRTDSCCSCDTHATLTCFLLPPFCFSCHRREQGSCDEDSRFVFWTRERLETIVCKYLPLKRVSTSAALVKLMKPSHASCFRQSVSAITEERFEVLWILFSHGLETRDAWHCQKINYHCCDPLLCSATNFHFSCDPPLPSHACFFHFVSAITHE